ncbi:hypothetical protein C8R43DRAFT_1245185 [Mycena crocata]|nr:hypothetical protein C8R43DRAFT_1245185 [Mycena crocata]
MDSRRETRWAAIPSNLLQDSNAAARIHYLLRLHQHPDRNTVLQAISTLFRQLAGYDGEIAAIQSRLETRTQSNHIYCQRASLIAYRDDCPRFLKPIRHFVSQTLMQFFGLWQEWVLQDDTRELFGRLCYIKIQHAMTTAHLHDCRQLLRPVRHLPSEILVMIFESWREWFPRKDLHYAQHLAQGPLLTIAQVCSRWRCIVMGTPSLWNTIYLEKPWTDYRPGKVMRLLRTTLERGRRSPLSVVISGKVHLPAIRLLATHSDRWKLAEIDSLPCDSDFWSSVKGKLPLLETLAICTEDSKSVRVDLSDIPPRLQHLTISATLLPGLSKPLLQQLHTFICLNPNYANMAHAVHCMSLLRHGATCRIEFDDDLMLRKQDVADPPIQSTTSNISSLSIAAVWCFDARRGIHSIFTALVLPNLHDLTLKTTNFRLAWPHDDFLSLCERSSFHTHLKSLDVSHVTITAHQVLECLSKLPALERLTISDNFPKARQPHLISDLLLNDLSRNPESPCPCPGPNLRVFRIHTLLRFDDDVLLTFLRSRLQAGRSFECEILWLTGYHRQLDPIVVDQINALRAKNGLVFLFAEAERW